MRARRLAVGFVGRDDARSTMDARERAAAEIRAHLAAETGGAPISEQWW